MVSHLRERGINPQPCLPVLRALGVRQALTAQLNSSQTIFADITLVPSFCVVQIDRGGPKIIPLPKSRLDKDYIGDLHRFIFLWRSRFATLASDPRVNFTVDLSGGLDSRVVFAFALASGAMRTEAHRFHVASQTRMPKDFAAASTVARAYDVTLNGPPFHMRTSSSVEIALEGWREHSLGVYLPIYLTPYDFDPLTIRGHGAGGGTFRDLFTRSLEERLRSTKKYFELQTFDDYLSIVLDDLHRISTMRPAVDQQKLHYREFRNRFHFGHSPHKRAAFTPLNSILLDDIIDQPEVQSNRIYFDTMDCLVPGIKNYPYDDPAKEPDSLAPSAAAHSIGLPPAEPGSVYADFQSRGEPTSYAKAAFTALYSEADRALGNSRVQDLIGEKDVLARCRASVNSVKAESKRPRANHPTHQDVSYVLAAAFAADA
nr:asparagine synthase-related protein [Brevibacterium daeguense]